MKGVCPLRGWSPSYLSKRGMEPFYRGLNNYHHYFGGFLLITIIIIITVVIIMTMVIGITIVLYTPKPYSNY